MSLVVCVVIGCIGLLAYRSDPRWQRLVETAPIALDSKTGLEWLKDGYETYPKLSDGQPVDVSAYERIGFVKQGAMLVIENPLGTGFHRNAFNFGMDQKYELHGTKAGMHAHSGVIDFAIANGLPGLLLWLLFLWSLFIFGWRVFRASRVNNKVDVAPALMLIFIVTGFATRGFVDSVFQGYEFEQFMFLVAIFYVLSSMQLRGSLAK